MAWKFNKRRLKSLINVMQRVVDNKRNFDLNSWQINLDEDGEYRLYEENAKKTEETCHKCGTSACVAGWLAVSPEFKRVGGKVDSGGAPKLGVSHTGFDSLAIFLECTIDMAFNIADPDLSNYFYGYDAEDVTAKVVVNRLTKLYETGE